MAGIQRIHGFANGGNGSNVTGSEGAFFSGYQPLMLVIADTGVGSADSVAGDGAITLGNRSKVLKTIQNFASLVMIDNGNNANSVAVIVDGASANRSDGANEVNGEFGALVTAINNATGLDVSVSWGDQLNGNGSFDF